MIRRETDAELANRILNDPGVRPFMTLSDAPIDIYPALRMAVVLSNGEDAIGLFEQVTPKHPERWQAHTAFAPTCRGRKAINTAKEMIAWMQQRGASVIWGATPLDNRPARLFNRMIGGVPVEIDMDSYNDGPVEIFEVRL